MNIQTVAENLRNTIAGKENYLTQQQLVLELGEPHERIVAFTIVKMLEVNIDELRRILQDVEQCVPKEPSNPYHNADSGLYGPEYQGQ